MGVETFSRGWSLLLCPRPGMRVLELAEDGGERARALRAAGAEVTCLRRREDLARQLQEQGFAIRLATDVGDSPALAAGDEDRFDAAVMSLTVGGAAGEWPTARPEALLRLARRALRPGGSLVVAIPNPVYRLPVLRSLLGRLQGLPEETDRVAVGPPGFRLTGERWLRGLLESAGLRDVRVFMPLPDAARLKFLLPLEDPRALRYFFDNLAPRPASWPRRAALRLAAAAARAGLLGRLAPEYEAIGVRPCSP